MAAEKGLNAAHHVAGSANPVTDHDQITFVTMRFCPFAQRAALVLLNKKVPFKAVNVSLQSKPDWFLELNPLGKLPVLVLPNKDVIFESEVCADYIDETFGTDDRLTASDPAQKAKDKSTVALFGKAVSSMYALRFAKRDAENFPQLVADFVEFFLRIEKNLSERKTKYFSGNEKPGMLDYMIWPWMERYECEAKLCPPMKLDNDKFPTLVRILHNFHTRFLNMCTLAGLEGNHASRPHG